MGPGDLVKLRLARDELECTILESHEKDVVLVKLSSGYNIGIPKDHILGEHVLRKAEARVPAPETPRHKDLPSIGLVMTGGTIASRTDPKTGGVNALTDLSSFAQFYPGLFQMVNVKSIETPFMTLSENMSPEKWIDIAVAVKKLLDDPEIEGVVVTHGTDTLHYTAAALSFFLKDLNKPVVLTYAQRSIDRGSSDADLNLRCAARFALSNCAEVMLVGHANMSDDYCHALRGTKVRKLHASRRDAFKSVNCRPVANVWPDKVEFLSHFKAKHSGKTELDAVFNDKVAVVKFYPGQSPDIVDYYRMHGYKGLIIEAYGLGNLPSADVEHSWIPALKKLIREGCVVCTAAQTIFGRLNPKVYSTGRGLTAIGVVALEDMLSETAFVKLGWILGHRGWKEKAAEKMLENISGEFNPILNE
jgi:glutamyl-tRNA(Gln) amidotransferase subunit D